MHIPSVSRKKVSCQTRYTSPWIREFQGACRNSWPDTLLHTRCLFTPETPTWAMQTPPPPPPPAQPLLTHPHHHHHYHVAARQRRHSHIHSITPATLIHSCRQAPHAHTASQNVRKSHHYRYQQNLSSNDTTPARVPPLYHHHHHHHHHHYSNTKCTQFLDY